MSETIQGKIQLPTLKLDNLTASADQMAEFFDITMIQYERYITYSILGALELMKICILVFCYKLLKEFVTKVFIIDRNDAILRQFIRERGNALQSNLRATAVTISIFGKSMFTISILWLQYLAIKCVQNLLQLSMK